MRLQGATTTPQKGRTFLLFVVFQSCACGQDQPVVQTLLGEVRGVRIHHLKKPVDAFLGIPFAKPPVGNLRFRPPLAASPWSGTFDGSKKSTCCMQFPVADPNVGWVPSGLNYSEDCLYLNVWTPSSRINSAKTKSVLVWIHGGGFRHGCASMDIYDGGLLSAYGDVVVVSMNYRIGAFGFLISGTDDSPGNQGLLDQLLALSWIKDNIKAFGGNPEQIVLFGESAGAWAIGYHILSPLSSKLFHGAIIQSGGTYFPYIVDSFDAGVRKTKTLANLTNCSITKDKKATNDELKAMVNCLRNKKAYDISLFQGLSCELGSICFLPRYGDTFLPTNPLIAADQGLFATKNILTGTLRDEGTIFVSQRNPRQLALQGSLNVSKSDMLYLFYTTFRELKPIAGHVYDLYLKSVPESDSFALKRELGGAFGDWLLVCPTVFSAEKFSAKKSSTYYYSMTHRKSTADSDPWIGATHFEDIQFVFGLPLRESSAYGKEDIKYSSKIMDTWITFANTGKPPQIGGKDWPVFDKESRWIVELDTTESRIVRLPQRDKCNFWERLTGPTLDRCYS